MYVLDASVMLKWFVEENNTPEAVDVKKAHLRGEYSLVIPDLAIYEVANALRYNREFSTGEVNSCCANLFNLNMDIVAPVPELINNSIEIAFSTDITFYDAFYIALADKLGQQFLTADEKLYRKTCHLSHVLLLSKLNAN